MQKNCCCAIDYSPLLVELDSRVLEPNIISQSSSNGLAPRLSKIGSKRVERPKAEVANPSEQSPNLAADTCYFASDFAASWFA